jgi:hypothetical protein
VRLSEYLACPQRVVPGAEQAEIVGRRRAAEREGVAVFECEEAARAATAALRVGEGALSAVALPHCAGDFHGDMTGAVAERAAFARLAVAEAALRFAGNELVEGAFEQHGEIATR